MRDRLRGRGSEKKTERWEERGRKRRGREVGRGRGERERERERGVEGREIELHISERCFAHIYQG